MSNMCEACLIEREDSSYLESLHVGILTARKSMTKKRTPMNWRCIIAFLLFFSPSTISQDLKSGNSPRESLLLDFGWKFHLGDAASTEGDFLFGQEASFAKAGEVSPAALPDRSEERRVGKS